MWARAQVFEIWQQTVAQCARRCQYKYTVVSMDRIGRNINRTIPEFKRYINCKIFLINVWKWQFDWSFKCHWWGEPSTDWAHSERHRARCLSLLVYCFCGFHSIYPFRRICLCQNAYRIFGRWKPARTPGRQAHAIDLKFYPWLTDNAQMDVMGHVRCGWNLQILDV